VVVAVVAIVVCVVLGETVVCVVTAEVVVTGAVVDVVVTCVVDVEVALAAETGKAAITMNNKKNSDTTIPWEKSCF
jgi:hypothetical protein